MDVITQLSILNEKFYKKCGDLYEAMEYLGPKLYNEMLQNFFKLYQTEYNVLMTTATIHYKNVKFVLKLKDEKLVPRRCGFLWLKNNEAKLLAIRETNTEVKSEFELRKNAVEHEEERLKPAPPVDAPAPPAHAPEQEPAKPKQAPLERHSKAKTAPAAVLHGQIGIDEINGNSK